MATNVRRTIDTIKELSNGSVSDLLEACQILHNLHYTNVLRFHDVEVKILPFFVQLISSGNQRLQLEGAQFIYSFISTRRYYKVKHLKLAIDAGALPKLLKLLDSSNHSILKNSLNCLIDIAAYFPSKVIEEGAIPPLSKCLRINHENISYKAAKCLKSVSNERQCITAIIDASCVEPLIKLLESEEDDVCADVLHTLVKIVSFNSQLCQYVLDRGALRYLKVILSRVMKRTRSENKTQFLAVIFIEFATSFNRAQIDMVVDENIIPLILQFIKSAANLKFEIHSIKVIQNIIKLKREFLPILLNDDDIITMLCSKLQMVPSNTESVELMETVLSALVDLIKLDEYKEIIRQKMIDSSCQGRLRDLSLRKYARIYELSNMIYTFIKNDNEHPQPQTHDDADVGDLNDEEDERVGNEEVLHNQRKRPLNADVKSDVPDNKRFRVSMEQTNVVVPDSFVRVDRDLYGNDFDVADYRNPAPLDLSTVTAVNATTLNAGLNSLGSYDNATAEETLRRSYKIETREHSQHGDLEDNSIPSTSVQPGLPEATAGAIIAPSDSNTVTEVNATTLNAGINYLASSDNATADETLRSNFKNEITEDSQHENMDFVSIPTTSFEPDDPEGTTTAFENSSTQPILFSLPADVTTLEYCYPPESFLKECCEKKLELKFDRKRYLRFLSTINFDSINANSKPSECLPTNDISGFECLSMLFTFNPQNTEIIEGKINKQFTTYASQEDFDGDKIVRVVGRPYILKSEHLETIARWFKCRIMVYNNGDWEKYGDWNSEEENVPTFVLEKKQIKNDLIYQIVLSLKND